MRSIVAFGEALGLLVADRGLPLGVAHQFTRSVAGSESNVAIGLARLDHPVRFLGSVGADAPGLWVRNTLRAEGIDISGLRVDDARPTGLLLRDAPIGRPLTVSYYRGGSAGSMFDPSNLTPEVFVGADALFVSGISLMLAGTTAAAAERLLDMAAEAGVHVFLDPNVRERLAPVDSWRSRLTEILPRIDTLLVGEQELASLGWPADGSELLSDRLSTVVVKRGVDGAESITATDRRHAAARVIRTVDPVGAGDAFTAGWIAAWSRGANHQRCLEEANVVASLVVSTMTDIAGLPTAAERGRIMYGNGADVDR